jgi:hypothetical protein
MFTIVEHPNVIVVRNKYQPVFIDAQRIGLIEGHIHLMITSLTIDIAFSIQLTTCYDHGLLDFIQVDRRATSFVQDPYNKHIK